MRIVLKLSNSSEPHATPDQHLSFIVYNTPMGGSETRARDHQRHAYKEGACVYIVWYSAGAMFEGCLASLMHVSTVN